MSLAQLSPNLFCLIIIVTLFIALLETLSLPRLADPHGFDPCVSPGSLSTSQDLLVGKEGLESSLSTNGHVLNKEAGPECACTRQNEHCICSGNGLAMSALYPEMRFSWEIKSVDALFCNGLTRFGDLSKEGILQAIKEGDLRFLQVLFFPIIST